MQTLGALEAGGTKMVMAVFSADGTMQDRVSIPTREPETTMPEMISYFASHHVSALGIGCFGPLDLNPDSLTYGYITMTPKLSWRMYPLTETFQKELNVPIALDTDVNGAAIAESQLGAAKGLSSCLYVTIGTGIGGGVIINGKPVHGLMHPELGHQLITPCPDDPSPEGFCPYHKGCLEGLASGPAMEKRWGISARDLPHDHAGWQMEADYLAKMCVNAMMSFSPEKIILGGGVMQQSFLIPLVRKKTLAYLGGYISSPAVDNGLEDYIVPPALGVNSGITGAYLLACSALASQKHPD